MAAKGWEEQVAPELRALYRAEPQFTYDRMWKIRLFRVLFRVLMPAPRVPADVSFREVQLPEGQHVRIFEPKGDVRAAAAMLWIHGGGRIMGAPKMMDQHCIRVVQRFGIPAVAISHRFAPEHPYPTGLDDCVRAWTWVREHAQDLRVDPSRIAIGGESSGGGLGAELAQRIRDAGGVQPAAQVLVYPMLDDRTAMREDLTARQHPCWNNASNHFAWSRYLGMDPGSPGVLESMCASRRENLSGLPPAWLTVGDLDLFLDENLAYANRLEAAGVKSTVHRVTGGFHGYFRGTDEAPIVEMWASLEAFLKQMLSIE